MSLRSDRKTCRGCGRFLLIGDDDLCEVCSDHLRDPCPMGCGNQTEDVAGGPCQECWDLADDPEPSTLTQERLHRYGGEYRGG